jgi:membrane-bound lytic murein transglycosylase D
MSASVTRVVFFTVVSFFAVHLVEAQQAKNSGNATLDQKEQRKADSLKVVKYYDLAATLFSDFFEVIHPIEIKGFTREIAIADAPEQISRDLFFSPSPDVLLMEDADHVYEFIPLVSEALVADRLSRLNTQIPMVVNDKVKTFVEYFAVKRRKYTLNMLAKQNIYFPLFERTLAEYGLPDELKYLSIVESALNPVVRSKAGAVGLWQFMPQTGQIFGLKQNNFIDERMDPEKSTVAACKYLLSLYRFFGNNWELALAAYNCGPGTVKRAIKRSGGKTDFWEIYPYLPAETRSYVPMFTAVTYIMNYAEEHNLIQTQPYFAIRHEVVEVNGNLLLKDMAARLEVCLDDLKELNPELKQAQIPYGVKKYPLRIPADRLEVFYNNQPALLASHQSKTENSLDYTLERNSGLSRSANAASYAYTQPASTTKPAPVESKPVASTRYHVVKSGESLGLIAQKYKVSIAQLKQWNNLKSDLIQANNKLLVSAPAKNTSATVANNVVNNAPAKTTPSSVSSSPAAKAPTASAKIHVVSSGDTLWNIASKYKLTVEQLKKLNNMTSDKIQLGQKLKVS